MISLRRELIRRPGHNQPDAPATDDFRRWRVRLTGAWSVRQNARLRHRLFRLEGRPEEHHQQQSREQASPGHHQEQGPEVHPFVHRERLVPQFRPDNVGDKRSQTENQKVKQSLVLERASLGKNSSTKMYTVAKKKA